MSNLKRIPVSTCPVCGYSMDSATSVEERDLTRPRPGDLSVCLNCGTALMFNSVLKLQAMPREVVEELAAGTRERLLETMLRIKRRGPFK